MEETFTWALLCFSMLMEVLHTVSIRTLYINIIIVKKSYSMKKYSLFKSVQVDVISVSEFSLLKLKKKTRIVDSYLPGKI